MLAVQIGSEYNLNTGLHNPLEKTFLKKRYDFFERYQNVEESIHAYLSVIRLLAEFCDFHVAEKEVLIRDRLVSGMLDKQLQSLILESFEHPSIEEVIDLCMKYSKEKRPADVLAVKIEETHVDYIDTEPINTDVLNESSESSDEEEQRLKTTIVNKKPKKQTEDAWLCRQCPICDATLDSFKNLRGHLTEHVLYKEFNKADFRGDISNRLLNTKCLICQRQWDTHDRLIQHYALHSHGMKNLPNINCTVCGKSVVVRLLKKHMEIHNDLNTYPCTQCDKILNSRYQLKIHMRVHLEHKPNLTCGECGKVFLRQVYLTTHKSKLHPVLDEKIKSLECYVCKQKLLSLASLKHHIYKHFVPRNHLCPKCGLGFRSNSLLQRHLMRADHNGEHNKKFECSVCKKKLYDITQYKNHFTTHTGQKPHKCTYPNCTKAYRIAKDLKDHFRVHTKEKPYKCKLCSYEGSNAAYLRRHMLVHRGRPRKWINDKNR